MGVCTVSAKLFLTILGVCFAIAAGGLMYIGCIIFSGYKEYDKVYNSDYIWVPGGAVITASIFMFILGLIACIAACKENKCMLGCFFTILLVIVLMELTASIVSIVYKDELKEAVYNGMDNAFKNYGQTTDESQDYTQSIDYIQEKLKCCGLNKSTDWFLTKWGLEHFGQVPKSCCNSDKKQCTGSPIDILKGDIYTQGCYLKVNNELTGNLKKIIGASLGLLLIQVIALIFSCVLFCNKKKVSYVTLENDNVEHGYRA